MMSSLPWISFMTSRFSSFRVKALTGTQPDHFRIVYLPDIRQLDKAMKKMKEFFATYKQV